jgi:hypothetical protein
VELEHDVVVGHRGVAGLLLLAVLVQALRGLTRKLSVRLFAPDHLLRVLARRCLLLFLRALGDQHVLLLLLRQGNAGVGAISITMLAWERDRKVVQPVQEREKEHAPQIHVHP